MTEQWKDIEGYDYQISCAGNVRKAASYALDNAWSKINALGGTLHPQDSRDSEIRHDEREQTIYDALKIIEALGGIDPLRRKTAAPVTDKADEHELSIAHAAIDHFQERAFKAEALLAALKYYADKTNYELDDYRIIPILENDLGDRARKAIKQHQETQ